MLPNISGCLILNRCVGRMFTHIGALIECAFDDDLYDVYSTNTFKLYLIFAFLRHCGISLRFIP